MRPPGHPPAAGRHAALRLGSRSWKASNIIGLHRQGRRFSLEPGGQFELSGAPLKTVHETCAEVNTASGSRRAKSADEIGAGVLGLGFAPTWTLDEVPVMPKGRYDIMRATCPRSAAMAWR